MKTYRILIHNNYLVVQSAYPDESNYQPFDSYNIPGTHEYVNIWLHRNYYFLQK